MEDWGLIWGKDSYSGMDMGDPFPPFRLRLDTSVSALAASLSLARKEGVRLDCAGGKYSIGSV